MTEPTVSDKRRASLEKARAARAAKRAVAAQPAEPAPQSVAPGRTSIDLGRTVAVGRDGSALTRRRTVSSDVFHIPPEIIPQGWDYQWNPYEVLGKPLSAIEANMALAMAENGWRDVPADRHPGLFMPQGHKGSITRDGLVLQERPMVLTQEAKQEEYAKARRQVTDQIAQLRLDSNMPAGFSRDNPKLRAMERQGTRTEYAPAPDIPRPALQIDQG